MAIPVIDIFAGPGGLGEGFSSVVDKKGDRFFDIKLSIEKNEDAHKTLQLRSFFRQFPIGKVPKKYYDLLKIIKKDDWNIAKDKLFKQYSKEGKIAIEEAWKATLGVVPEEELDERISKRLGGEQNWLLIGGPPCQAYSLVGRSRVGGIDDKDHRVYLYKEYLRIIAVHQPAVFVMENVKGLLSAKVNGKKIFNEILNDLKNPSKIFPKQGINCPTYKIYSLVQKPVDELFKDGNSQPKYNLNTDYLIKSEKFGIPQKRHRVILLGVREDIRRENIDILKEEKEVPLKKVIGDLPKLRSGVSRKIIEVKKGEDGLLKLKYEKIVDTPETWQKIVLEHVNDVINQNGFIKFKDGIKIKLPNADRGKVFLNQKPSYSENIYEDWYADKKLTGLCNHETRAHLKEDLKRYFFAALFVREHKRFPRLHDYPKSLLPSHKNALSGKFADRFRVQLANEPATTVTSHISKDGHYFIHYDPEQCRSLTVREAARIQTFPDNYYFCGSRTAQYIQVGNAVPPLLAKKIGVIVKNIFDEQN